MFTIDYGVEEFSFSCLYFPMLDEFVESPEAHNGYLACNCSQMLKQQAAKRPLILSWTFIDWNLKFSAIMFFLFSFLVLLAITLFPWQNKCQYNCLFFTWETPERELISELPYCPGLISKWVSCTKVLALISVVSGWIVNESIWSIIVLPFTVSSHSISHPQFASVSEFALAKPD